jgi:DNA-binding transcriptional ArsR family regulator
MSSTAAPSDDPTRASIIAILMDGRALTAGELARAAGVPPQAARQHLEPMAAAGLVTIERQGPHRYHRLTSTATAYTIGSDGKAPLAVGPRDEALRRARTCYNHLAGRVAVAMADRMTQQGLIALTADGGVVTQDGMAFLRNLGVHPPRRGRQPFCRPCLDWSERRPHIAGAVGTAICQACFAQGWVSRIEGSRAVTITPAGQVSLSEAFGADVMD